MNPIYASIPTSIFEKMSHLAGVHNAFNLGQGFPDDAGPLDVRQKAAEAVVEGWNQYPPMMGLMALRENIAAHYQRFQGLTLNPQTEIMVTSGATEALTACLLAVINNGDEVIVFEPAYDAYLPLIKRAGGVPKIVTLKPPFWRFTREDLSKAFTPKTKAVLINTPLNPTGTLIPREDLELLGEFASRHNAIVIADEVWEHVIFDGKTHTSVLQIESLKERSIKISSAGKIFSLTGWKVGMVMANATLMRVLGKAHQYITFTTPPNLQTAVAYGLMKEDDYFLNMRANFQSARDYLRSGLEALNFHVLPVEGTYFLNIDLKKSDVALSDVEFSEKLVENFRVATIPVSAFYSENAVSSVVRLCFAKKPATLDGALAGLKAFRG
jgi:N-succinyldiaminopimelate aminotransferase